MLIMSKLQVALPVNIKNRHWYGAVVNARKRVVQVLDSMPSSPENFKKTHPELENMVRFCIDYYRYANS